MSDVDPVEYLTQLFKSCLRQLDRNQRDIAELMVRLDRIDTKDLVASLDFDHYDDNDDDEPSMVVPSLPKAQPTSTLSVDERAVGGPS